MLGHFRGSGGAFAAGEGVRTLSQTSSAAAARSPGRHVEKITGIISKIESSTRATVPGLDREEGETENCRRKEERSR